MAWVQLLIVLLHRPNITNALAISQGKSFMMHNYALDSSQFSTISLLSCRVDGMDALAVFRASEWAKEWTISGKGPLVMEFTTYRYGGHSMSDPGTTYRTRDEIQQMRSTSDPLMNMKKRLIDLNIATEAEIKAIDKESRKLVDQAAKEAEASTEPDVGEFCTEVYVKGTEPKSIRGRVPSETHHFY